MNSTSAIGKSRIDSILSNRAFKLLLIYLLLDYGRPQALIPILNVLHLPAIITVILLLTLIQTGGIDLETPQSKLFIALLALMTIHGPIATNNYWALMMWKAMLLYFIIFLSMYRFVDSMEKFHKMMNYWVAVHIFLAVVGVIKGGKGIGGFIGDENDLCMTVNLIIPYSFFLAMSAKKTRKKVFFFLLTGLFIFTNILTFSRGGFLGMVAIGVYIWFRSPRKMATTVLVGILVAFVLLAAPQKYWARIHTISEEGTRPGSSGEERLYTWKIGWAMFLDNPILGVGQGNFPWVFRKYEVETGHGEGFHTRSIAGRAAHSLYFTLIPELGMAGIILFLLFLKQFYRDIKTIRLIRKRGDPSLESRKEIERVVYLSYAMEGSLVGYLVSGVFISILYYPNFWLLIAFAHTLQKVMSRELEMSQAAQS